MRLKVGRKLGSRNKCSSEDCMSVDLATYTAKITALENELVLEKSKNLNLQEQISKMPTETQFEELKNLLKESEDKYKKMRKKCGDIETRLMKKK